MKKKKPRIIFILGPTGVGKSAFAVSLARRIGGEIISCDSMQIYKGMAVLSQYPSSALRKAVRHHMIGTLTPSREWSAAGFIEKAKDAITDIIRRGNVPIVAGGTGLYARALIEGLFPSPPKDEKIRNRFYRQAVKEGNEAVYEKLKKIDPKYASKIHPNDIRRVVRALEIYELTGRPISEQHKETMGIRGEYKISIFILNRDREELYDRINERIEEMFEGGMIDEVKRLSRRRLSKTAKAVLGYAEVRDYIVGKCAYPELKESLKMHTRQYAKRQLTWFRKEKGAVWLELGGRAAEKALVARVARTIDDRRWTMDD